MSSNPPHIAFLIYLNRSGSTFLSALLENFDEIGVTLESPVLYHLLTGRHHYRNRAQLDDMLHRIYADRKFKEWEIPEEDLRNRLAGGLPLDRADLIRILLGAYFERTKPEARFWICKIGNPYLIGTILKIFDDAKFVFIYRDGRAVFCSQKKAFSRNAGDVMERDPVRAARAWATYLRVVNLMSAEADILKVKYEDLVLETENQLLGIYRFLTGRAYTGEAVRLDASHYHRKIPRSQVHLHGNVGKNPLASRIEAWKQEIAPSEGYLFEKTAYPMLMTLGYPPLFYHGRNDFPPRRYLLYRIRLAWGRAARTANRFKFFVRHPAFAWKRVMTRIETRF